MSRTLQALLPHLSATAASEPVLHVAATSLEDPSVEIFAEWVTAGHAASMKYLERNVETRRRPETRYPWARSALVITVPYDSERLNDPSKIAGVISRYAQGDDYHDVLDDILTKLEAEIAAMEPGTKTRRYVDTGPLSDRSLAAKAGIGWIGRNSMLIDPEHGSYFFIGVLLTSLEPGESAAEVADRCGECTRCVDACPTGAILPNRTVAAESCISYATIEHRGAMPDGMKSHLAGNVFGCDICQEVCPWNAAPPEPHPRFRTRDEYRARPVTDLLQADQAEFSRLFRKSAVKRAKRAGMIRNAILVTKLAPSPIEAETDDGIRDSAEWLRRAAPIG